MAAGQGMGPILVCLDTRSCHRIMLWVSGEINSSKLEMGNFIMLMVIRSLIYIFATKLLSPNSIRGERVIVVALTGCSKWKNAKINN